VQNALQAQANRLRALRAGGRRILRAFFLLAVSVCWPADLAQSLRACDAQVDLKIARSVGFATEVIDGFQVLRTDSAGATFRLYARITQCLQARGCKNCRLCMPKALSYPKCRVEMNPMQ